MKTRIPVSEPYITKSDVDFVSKILREKQVSGRAPVVKEFEAAFAKYLGTHHAMACSSGTSALHLAVKALGLRDGDEVIVPTFTMMSPILALLYERLTPVLVDVDRRYWVSRADQIMKKITSRTRAILIVHTYGNPAFPLEVSKIAKKNGLYLIEDCAEAMGATCDTRKTGTFGDVSTFSLFANKLITSGEGGLVCTSNDSIAERINGLRDLMFGKENKFLHEGIGYNYRMSALQAALALSQLGRVDLHLKKIRGIAKSYHDLLSTESGLQLHQEVPGSIGAYWMYSVLIGNSARTKGVISELHQAGIETRPFFVPAHRQPVMKSFKSGRFPVSDYISKRGINLPSGLSLKEQQIEYVCDCLRRALARPIKV
jgi:perosamine synthetase